MADELLSVEVEDPNEAMYALSYAHAISKIKILNTVKATISKIEKASKKINKTLRMIARKIGVSPDSEEMLAHLSHIYRDNPDAIIAVQQVMQSNVRLKYLKRHVKNTELFVVGSCSVMGVAGEYLTLRETDNIKQMVERTFTNPDQVKKIKKIALPLY